MAVRSKVLALMFALTFITYLDRVAISAAAQNISTELGLTRSEMGVVFSAFILGYVLFEIPGGWMADRFGARALLTRIVLWWSAFTALTGAAWSYASLLAIRFLFGCGEAGAFPGCASAIARWFPAAERGRAQAWILVGSRIGAAAAPAFVLALMARLGWREVFVILGAVGVVWAAVWARWYRNRPEEHPQVTIAELSVIAAGRASASHSAATPWARLLRSRNVWALCFMYSGYTWGLYFYLSWLPTYLREGLGLSWSAVGYAAAAPLLAGAVTNYGGGWLTDRLSRRFSLKWARRAPAMAGLGGAAAFLGAAALASDPAVALVALALSFGSADLILAVSWAACLDIGREHAGAVSGFMNSLGQIGGLAAPAAIGALVESSGSWRLPLLLSAAYYVVSAATWLLIDPEQAIVDADEAVPLPQG